MIGLENLLLHPYTIEMCLDKAFIMLVYNITIQIEWIQTKKEVIQWVNNNLFNQIKIEKVG